MLEMYEHADFALGVISYNDPQLPLAAELGSRMVRFIDGLQPH